MTFEPRGQAPSEKEWDEFYKAVAQPPTWNEPPTTEPAKLRLENLVHDFGLDGFACIMHTGDGYSVRVGEGHGFTDEHMDYFWRKVQGVRHAQPVLPMKELPTGANIAEEATKLVCGDRNESYGPPTDDYRRTGAAWSALLIHKLKPGCVIEPREAMLMMATMKVCREMTKPKRDNRVDAIGYMLCEDWDVTGVKPNPSKT